MISIIVAIAQNRAIGKDNELLWHIPEDLKRFKRITSGHPVIMGKRTWFSLPRRPLPGRRNIVLTDLPQDEFEGAERMLSVDEVLSICKPDEENFIIGGASVYKQFLPHCERLYLTLVHKDFEGDVFFPVIRMEEWYEISREDIPPSESFSIPYSNLILQRER